ncbi:MAG: FGGY family carbohydrate kinase [Mycobacterium sp.]
MSESATADLLLGIDVGTTGTKTMLLRSDGSVVAEAYSGYGVARPRPLIVEQDAEAWWQSVVQTVRSCLSAVDSGRVRAMSVSAQGGTLVAVDDRGAPLAPARSWLDRRAGDQVDRLADRFGHTPFFERTGWRLFGAYNCVQLLDLRQHDHDLFTSAAAFLGTADFLNLRLTGHRVSDLNSAGITQLTNAAAGDWDGDILDFIGVPESKLPELRSPGSLLGTLTPDAAAPLGLDTDVAVIAGGHDQYCAALGAGMTEPGDVLVSTGTAWVVLGITASPIPDPNQNFGFGPHVVDGVWGEFGSLRNGGVCLDWARALMSTDTATDDYATVQRLASTVAPGAEGLRFFPHFDGTNTPTWDDRAKGTAVGLELRHGKAEFYRAVMEGVCFELRRVLDGYQAFGPEISRLTVLGGAANSPLWTGIIADVLGRPVEVSQVPHSACVGAVILAGVGAGVWPDIASACAAAIPAGQTTQPSHNVHAYQDLFARYVAQAHDVLALYTDSSPGANR